ncbi:ankyrin repeat [Fusarium subglutinans]|uniref:Ankyrin repeat n=1 Tax=Gibberella subglutinans TaxID=42677 RepID=A0A8H5NZG6_GIBSU|nr:ankyrin repeat [Fusarium subglutinans]KAF5584287.1 ankyrin repeat [Fusarium subglutinans]
MDDQHDHLDTATLAPIVNITRKCLERFDFIEKTQGKDLVQRLINAPPSRGLQRSSFSFPGLHNHFLRWIHESGALSPLDLSLDEKLKGLYRLFSIVNRMLEWILRDLDRLANIPCSAAWSPLAKHDDHLLLWQEASMSIEDAVEHLHSVSLDMRRLSPQQFEDLLTTTETEEHEAFRENMIALVGRRFPAARKGLCDLLGKSIAARRRMLLQAQDRERSANRMSKQTASTPSQGKNTRPRSKAGINQKGQRTRSAGSASSTSVTTASQSNLQAPILEEVQGPSREALRRVMGNFTAPQHDSSDYPPMPKVSQGQAGVQCPLCFVVWEQTNSESVNLGLWKLHVDEHVKPYSCLFPRCAMSLTLFVHQQEWEDHMESVHSSDWLREVHTKQWYCDSGHENTFAFELEAQWREHVLDPASHPERQETPNRFQLKALSQLKQRRVLRDMYVCLLCDQIPEEVQQKLETGHVNPADLHNCVLSHVATHLKSLSLLAIPFLTEGADETAKLDQDSVVSTKGQTNRLLDDDPLPDLQIPASEIPPGQSPDLEHWIIDLNIEEGLDDDFEGYRQPNEAPDLARRSWTDYLPRCGDVQDPEILKLLGRYPVPKHLGSSETQTSTTDVDFQDDVGQTALSLAAQEDDTETMRQLIIMGADIELADRDGKTPLCWAAAEGKESAVKFLLDTGAQIEATEHIYGRTPLSWAAARGHSSVVRVLCTYGALVNALDNSKRTPMSWAASRGNEETLQLLLDAGAEFKSRDSDFSRTPLHWAATRNRAKNASLLLQHGAEIEAVDGSSKTPLCLASQDGYAAVVEVLLKNGADIETLHTKYTQTPLSLASGGGYEDVVQLLLEHGAKIDAKDSQGKTARDWAMKEEQNEIVKLLEAYQSERISLPYR